MRWWHWLLIGEAILSYAIPAYFLFWGVLGLPLWALGMERGDPGAIWNLFAVVGGILGIAGIVAMLAQVIAEQRASLPMFIWLTTLCLLGVLAIWVTMTGHFEAFELNAFTLITVVAPTCATIHLLILYGRLLARRDGPHRAAEDASH